MAQLDAFSAQIVKFVREMPDEALLDLVKQKLGMLGGAPDAGERGSGRDGRVGRVGRAGRDGRDSEPPTRVLPLAPPAAVAKGKRSRSSVPAPEGLAEPASSRRTIPPTAERQSMLESVERIVKAGSGMSASDVAVSAGVPQTRAAAALKELKLAKRIFQGGDRRFARYAGDAKTAEQASTTARQNAKGPTVPRPQPAREHARPRKRVPQPVTTTG